MSFLLLKARGIRMSFAGAEVLDVKNFSVYAGDRIGFVGANGGGKSTLLSVLAGELAPDSGTVERYCDIAYIRQFETEASSTPGAGDSLSYSLSLFGVRDKTEQETVSGGEAVRLRIARAFGSGSRLVFADEPTSNLDAEGVERVAEMLAESESFILVSHDRDLLNRVCNKIITLEDRDIAEYWGGFDGYKAQAEAKLERAKFEYGQYTEEKHRLEKVYDDKKAKAVQAVKKPKNVMRSDQKTRSFGVVRRSFDGRQRGFESAARNVQRRIDHMEIKERPAEAARIKLDFSLTEPPRNRIILSGRNIRLSYPAPGQGDRVIFDDAKFEIQNGEKAAVTGPNGSGKTSLFNMIANGHESIYKVPKARVGYFYQGFENLALKRTVLQNVLDGSVQKEQTVRSVLARLLFKRADTGKPAGALSGGERIKLSLAKLLVSNCNVLMLDEPTNYLDMPSIETLQAMLCEYEGTLLFVSHDRAFSDAVATARLCIRDKKIVRFADNTAPKESDMLREYQLASLARKMADAGEREKTELMREYMELKNAKGGFPCQI